MATLISLGAACTIALLFAAGLMWLRAAAPRWLNLSMPPRLAPSTGLVRWLQWPRHLLGQLVAPFIEGTAGRVVGQLLSRAELDVLFEPAEWVALSLGLTLLTATVSMPMSILLLDSGLPGVGLAALVAGVAPWLWLLDRGKRLRFSVLRDLPGSLDTLTLALEAGCAFGAALQLAVERAAESPLRRALLRCQQEMRAGRPRRETLERLAIPALSATIAAIVQAELTGVSLVPIIRAQAVRGTQERFARAEKLALEAPIRMLAPLVICIFPCTFIVVGFPIAATLFWGA